MIGHWFMQLQKIKMKQTKDNFLNFEGIDLWEKVTETVTPLKKDKFSIRLCRKSRENTRTICYVSKIAKIFKIHFYKRCSSEKNKKLLLS